MRRPLVDGHRSRSARRDRRLEVGDLDHPEEGCIPVGLPGRRTRARVHLRSPERASTPMTTTRRRTDGATQSPIPMNRPAIATTPPSSPSPVVFRAERLVDEAANTTQSAGAGHPPHGGFRDGMWPDTAGCHRCQGRTVSTGVAGGGVPALGRPPVNHHLATCAAAPGWRLGRGRPEPRSSAPWPRRFTSRASARSQTEPGDRTIAVASVYRGEEE
jgi:hypothetical protein